MQFSKVTFSGVVLVATLPAVVGSQAARTEPWTDPGVRGYSTPVVAAAAQPPAGSFHPEHLLVRFKSGVTRAGREAVHHAAGAERVLRDYHVVSGLQLVEVSEGRLPAALAAYASHPDVRYAEPDYFIETTAIPNDPDFGLLWGLHNTGQEIDGTPGTPGADIRAVQAWDFWPGDPDFRIAVIDTGVNYEHPDLQANIWTNEAELNGEDGIDDDGNGYIDDIHGYDFYNDDSDPMDDRNHGSHVAGTIAAVADNNEGVVGVNWHARIVALKIFGPGG